MGPMEHALGERKYIQKNNVCDTRAFYAHNGIDRVDVRKPLGIIPSSINHCTPSLEIFRYDFTKISQHI